MSNNQIVANNLQDEKILYPEFNKLKERYVRCAVRLSDFIARGKLSLFPLLLLNSPDFSNPTFLSDLSASYFKVLY